MINFNDSPVLGFLYNFYYQIKIPLSLGINIITTDHLIDNPEFSIFKNQQLVLFKINLLSENKASLRTYDNISMTIRVSEGDISEEVQVRKSGIKTLNTLNELEIVIFNQICNFGTFKFSREDWNMLQIRKEKVLEVIDLCSDNSTDENQREEEVTGTFDKLNDNQFQYKENFNFEELGENNFFSEECVLLSKDIEENSMKNQETGLLMSELENKEANVVEKSKITKNKKNKKSDKNAKNQQNTKNFEKSPQIEFSANYDSIIIPKILLKEFLHLLKAEDKNIDTHKNNHSFSALNENNKKVLGKRKRNEFQNNEKNYKSIRNKEEHNNNLSKDSTLNETDLNTNKSCTICFDPIKNPSKITGCDHIFCKDCINQWAQMTNTCPLCKIEFKKIEYYNDENVLINQKNIKKKKFKYEDEENDAWIDNCLEHCMKCKQTNDVYLMLVCDKCKYNVCHTYCAGLDVIPDDEWFCSECENIPTVKEKQSKKNNNNSFKENVNNEGKNHKRRKLDQSFEEKIESKNKSILINENEKNKKIKNSKNNQLINSLPEISTRSKSKPKNFVNTLNKK